MTTTTTRLDILFRVLLTAAFFAACLWMTGCAVKPADKGHDTPDPLTREELDRVRDDLRNEIRSIPAPQQLPPVDLSGLATKEQVQALEKRLETPAVKAVPPARKATYAYNDSAEQVVYYYSIPNCLPCARFSQEGHLVRINGKSVDWRPLAQCPATFDTPPTAPTFFWQTASGEWRTMPDWNGPVAFQDGFNRPVRSGVQATPIQYGAPIVPYGITYSGMPYAAGDVVVEPLRTAVVPVTRPGPMGLLWRTRLERIAY